MIYFIYHNIFFKLNLVFIADSHSGLFFWTPLKIPNLRSSYWSCSVNKMFLKILHWETPVLKSLFNRVAEHWCFPVEFAKFLRTPILKNICKRQLLKSVVLLGLPFLITSGSNWYLCFNFLSQFTVSFVDSSFTTIDNAIIRSSRLLVFCKESNLTNFAKFTRKHLC